MSEHRGQQREQAERGSARHRDATAGHRGRGRRPSRRVRLRRTTAATVLLGLLVVGSVQALHHRGRTAGVEAVESASSAAAGATRPGAGESIGASRPTGSRTTGTGGPATVTGGPATATAASDPEQDGSPADETTRPRAGSVPERGDGRLTVVPVPEDPSPRTSGRLVRYTVEVEGGLGVDASEVARTVQRVLLDRRGWQDVDGVRFVNVGPEEAAGGEPVDIRVTLASPSLTDRLCAPLKTLSQVSCWNGGRSVLNLRRWLLGDDSYGEDVARYRVYQVNHEVGHGLGHAHVRCPGAGKRAPVMLQQTYGLQGCTAWPYPSRA